jgi:hypothetical protein
MTRTKRDGPFAVGEMLADPAVLSFAVMRCWMLADEPYIEWRVERRGVQAKILHCENNFIVLP